MKEDRRFEEAWPQIVSALRIAGEVRIAGEHWWRDCPANGDRKFREEDLPEILQWCAEIVADPDREFFVWYDLPEGTLCFNDWQEEVTAYVPDLF